MACYCNICEELGKTGKAILRRDAKHLIQLKADKNTKTVLLCFQSREGESQLIAHNCFKCGQSYDGLGGFICGS